MENLSGGELQRFAICAVAIQEANVYMIDEPSSYLDVRQRLAAAKVGGRLRSRVLRMRSRVLGMRSPPPPLPGHPEPA